MLFAEATKRPAERAHPAPKWKLFQLEQCSTINGKLSAVFYVSQGQLIDCSYFAWLYMMATYFSLLRANTLLTIWSAHLADLQVFWDGTVKNFNLAVMPWQSWVSILYC